MQDRSVLKPYLSSYDLFTKFDTTDMPLTNEIDKSNFDSAVKNVTVKIEMFEESKNDPEYAMENAMELIKIMKHTAKLGEKYINREQRFETKSKDWQRSAIVTLGKPSKKELHILRHCSRETTKL